MTPEEQLASLEDMVVSLSAKFCRHASDVEDMRQEARLALWRALPDYDEGRGELRGFAWMVLRNHFLSTAKRSARRDVRRAVAELEFSGEYYAPRAENRVRLAAHILLPDLLRRLSGEERFAVLSFTGNTHEGIKSRRYLAKRLGVPPQDASRIYQAAMRKLKKRAEELVP